MNENFKNIISSCNQVYSMFDQEESSFDLNWSIPISNLSYSSDKIKKSFIYTPFSDINSLSHTGQINTYSGGGYIFEMAGTNEYILNLTNYLNSLKWIDSQTSALFVEFTLFNPNINLFMFCLILFEITSVGSFVNTIQFNPIDLYFINQSQFVSFTLIISILLMVFAVGLFLFEIKKLLEKGWKFFLDVYNYIDLAIFAFLWSAFSMFFLRLYESYKIISQINKRDSTFVNLQYISYCNDCFNYFMGICAACATLRLIKVFRFNKRIILFLIAFKQSLNELISFGFIFLLIWMAFVQIFYFLMNEETILFSSIINSMETCFQIILGKFNSTVFTGSSSALGPIIFIVYNIIIVFVFINLFVAILIENFYFVQNNENLESEDPELFLYLKSLVNYYIIDWIKSKNKNEINNIKSNLKDNKNNAILHRIDNLVIRFKRVKHIFFLSLILLK